MERTESRKKRKPGKNSKKRIKGRKRELRKKGK